ncbi:MAG: uridine phosphorylase [Thermodesulfobacteriota bacterium]
MKCLYHIKLSKVMLRGATIALLPGDPFRSRIIGETIAKRYGTESRELAWNREYCTHLARINNTSVLITSTGIGGPSTSIAIDELAQLGVETFIRVGTTGAIKRGIAIGDVIITTGAVRLDGASTHYAPIEYPAVAHHEVVNGLIEGSEKTGVRYHVGVTASSDTFYPGEERKDAFRRYVLRRFRGATEEWRNLHVLNYEMESATLLTLTASMGLRGGAITGVINRAGGGAITTRDLKVGEANVIKAAVSGIESLL